MILPRAAEVAARQFYNGYGYNGGYTSRWSSWGRWVLAGILIFIALLLLVGCLCFRSRRGRRSRRGKVTATNSTPMGYQASPAPYNNQNYGRTPYSETQGYTGGYSAPPGPPPQYGAGTRGYDGYGQGGVVEIPGSTYQPPGNEK